MKKIILIFILLPLVYITFFSEKSRLDADVKRMCAIDGGIKVYEVVRLPAERFEKNGSIYIPAKRLAKQGDEYYIENSTLYLIEGNPEMVQYHSKVFRRSDGKLLGEVINYSRRGGGIPGPWHVPAFRCPQKEDSGYLMRQLFVKG